jgi:tripartite-type tricarboxylate transporter receptor subunit TctC
MGIPPDWSNGPPYAAAGVVDAAALPRKAPASRAKRWIANEIVQMSASQFSATGLLGRCAVGVVGAILLAGMLPARAQTSYPTRPIHLIVGFAAGGPTDVLARIIGGKLSDLLGQQVVVENRTGASGNIATQSVVRAPNDGYTILMGANSNAVNESLFKNLPFKLADDLVAVAPLAEAPTVLVVHPSLEVKSVDDLITLARAKPGEIMYATAGKGTTTHLAGELFNLQARVRLTPVPYKGSGETTRDLLSGQIKVMFSPVPPVLPLIRDGRLRGIASTGLTRPSIAPELPTVAESGLAGFDMRMWFGLMAPAGTPEDIVDKLSRAAAVALESDTVKEALARQGYDPLRGTRAQFDAFIREEIDKWGKVVATFGPVEQ